jgi:hypothetical protein
LEGAITLDLPKNLMVVIQNFMNDCALESNYGFDLFLELLDQNNCSYSRQVIG